MSAWAGYAVGDWLSLTHDESTGWRLNGEPASAEDVRAMLGFVPSMGPDDVSVVAVQTSGSVLEILR